MEAIVSDASGSEVASISSGMYGDGAAGPVTRTVLDSAPIPALPILAGRYREFGFAVDQAIDGTYIYLMDVRNAPEFDPSVHSSGTNQTIMPNGMMVARVLFGTPAFTSPAAARAWMATDQYKQLKALLLSLKYA
ncbi:hypothetical protein AB4Z38_07825 [Arthrobacter sp. 2RAF6]|uniref:hypothetical protein n=1 Tax=Arthrobacter sp. 2RAF6 TaxID=3233002 RepID=UPI003F91C08E